MAIHRSILSTFLLFVMHRSVGSDTLVKSIVEAIESSHPALILPTKAPTASTAHLPRTPNKHHRPASEDRFSPKTDDLVRANLVTTRSLDDEASSSTPLDRYSDDDSRYCTASALFCGCFVVCLSNSYACPFSWKWLR